MVGPARDAGVTRAAAGNARPASSARSSCPICSRADTACAPAASPRRGRRPDRSSRACESAASPAATPRPARSTSGARLEPPMPSSTTSVKPSRLTHRRTCAGGRSSRPSKRASSASRGDRRSSSGRTRRALHDRDRDATTRPRHVGVGDVGETASADRRRVAASLETRALRSTSSAANASAGRARLHHA